MTLPEIKTVARMFLSKEVEDAGEYVWREWPMPGIRYMTLPIDDGGLERVSLRNAVYGPLRFSMAWSPLTKRAFWSNDFL